MSIYSLLPFSVSVLALSLAILVSIKGNKRDVATLSLICILISAFIWLFSYAMMYRTSIYESARIWSKIGYAGVLLLAPTFYSLTTSFLKLKRPKTTISIYVISFIFIVLLFKTNLIVEGVYEAHWGFQTKIGRLHDIFLLLFNIVWISCLVLLYRSYRQRDKISPLDYNRRKYVALAFIIVTLASIDFIPNYGYQFYPFGFLFVGANVSLLTYAVMRYRVMDVNIAITRAGILGLVYAGVVGIPFAVGLAIESHLSESIRHWWLIPMVLVTILASSGPFIYMRLQKRVEARLRAEEIRSRKQLRQLSHNMLRFTDLDKLLKLIVHYLVKVLKLKFAGIYIIDNNMQNYILKSVWQPNEGETHLPREFSKESTLAKNLNLKRLPIVSEELKFFSGSEDSFQIKELSDKLMKLKINTIIPSFLRKGLYGFLVLSDKKTNQAFSQEELNLLMVLSNEAALAIENAQFHRKEMSALVEKSRREALADMAPGASHQFNNRLVAISSSIELLLLKLANVNTDKVKDTGAVDFLKDLKSSLELIDQEVYKGKKITSAILKRSKAKVDFQELDLANLIENAYRLVLIRHSRPGAVKFREPEFNIILADKIPGIMASEALLQDSFFNLLDNACDAIQEKARMIKDGNIVTKEGPEFRGRIKIHIDRKDSALVTTIRDNGIGLKKENLKKMFTPYFTTKASSGKGTGLGLYVIRDFIETHKGRITCDSEYKEGTVFTIVLPIGRDKKKGDKSG